MIKGAFVGGVALDELGGVPWIFIATLAISIHGDETAARLLSLNFDTRRERRRRKEKKSQKVGFGFFHRFNLELLCLHK